MIASCQPLPRRVAEEMLQVVARALCDRTGDTPEQRDGRTLQMVMTTLGMAPRDGLEFMLATLAFGHFQVILDTMSDVFRGQTDALKAKTRAAIVPLGRSMLEMLRELRTVQGRPALQAEADAGAADVVRAQPQATAPSTPQSEAVAVPDPEALTEEELQALTDPRLGLPEEVIAWVAGTAPATMKSGSPEAGDAPPNQPPAAPVEPADRLLAASQRAEVVSEIRRPSPGTINDAAQPKGYDDKSAAVLRDQTLAKVHQTLMQEEVAEKARVASGD
jgi:hypothetical protein